jgi:hypothetical protein
MTDKIYSKTALIYDHLMNNINYSDWADYLSDIYKYYGNGGNYALELASGTCRLSSFMQKYFPNLFISDLSIEMLSYYKFPSNRFCCDMTSIPLKQKFDFIYSSFDSVNYLITKSKLKKHFHEIEKILQTNGIYTFDVSLEPNSINNVASLNRFGKFNKISYTQISSYDIKRKTHTNYFEISEDVKNIYKEKHVQKIFPLETYFEIIDKTNMFVVECFDSFSFQDANSESERVQFIIKKKKNA